MEWIFEIKDRTGRDIHLSKGQWRHINEDHPEVADYLSEIKEALIKPDKYKKVNYDKDLRYFYKYIKYRKSKSKFLLVLVKYLNGKGFIITSYFMRNIK